MRRTHLITTAALVAACAVPATAAAHYGQNLQSPDTRDAAANAKRSDYSGGYMNAAGGDSAPAAAPAPAHPGGAGPALAGRA